MALLTEEEIKEINKLCPSDQGVFFQPQSVPVEFKEHCIYMRWETGGYSGGGYHEESYAIRYENNDQKPKFVALDLVLKRLCPQISYLQYRDLERLIKSNSDTYYEYYGNSTDYEVDYIVLSHLEKYLVAEGLISKKENV